MELDLLVRGGLVVDGSGDPAVRADVGIVGDRIVAAGEIPDPVAARVIDATERVVAPGFIDVHVHSETALRGNADRYGSVLQGVTTHLTGPDGFGWAPLADGKGAALWRTTAFAYGQPDLAPSWPTVESYLDGFAGQVPVNVVPMAPHQAIRFAVMGWRPHRATTRELARMKAITGEWLDAGAVGLNTGLDYPPAALVTTDEIVELCRVVAKRGGVYASHIRYQGSGRAGALREAAEIGRRAGVPVRVSHESVDDESDPILDAARLDVDLTIDWYVYPAGSSHLMVWLPVEEQVGGVDALLERLRDPVARARIAAILEERLRESFATGAREYFADTRTGRHIGRSIGEIAAERGRSWGETAVELLEEESPDAVLVFKRGVSEEAFSAIARRTVAHPAFTLASDGLYHGALPHPRGYGCFARFLRWAVRELNAISLEDAVRVMSAAPAERFGISDRGRVASGLAADLVIFDPETVADAATWDQPRRPPTGIDAVIVNGEIVVDHGTPTGRLPGRVVRRPSGP
jgi:N-acyl-D-amino-acid deacylase